VDGWDSIFAALPGIGEYGGLGVVLVIAIRMVVKADSRYHAEVRDHERTQRALDDERERRRKAEDALSEVRSGVRVRELNDEVAELNDEVAELKAQIAKALPS
jgi:predicted  nucleic acid-binding Zn-ribbon protein